MNAAFHSIWQVLRTEDPFRDYANDRELGIAIGHKLKDWWQTGKPIPCGLDTSL